jgi:MSHA biogenesis protein MshQ
MGNTMLVTSHAIPNNNTWQAPPTSGMTQAYQVTSGTEMVQVSYALQAAAGATGTKRATDLGPDAADVGNAHILALRPGLAFTQSAYRLYNNANSTDVGSALAAQNTPATLGAAGATFRLRMLLHVSNVSLAISGQAFKLQFAVRSGTCDTAFSGETYADVTAASVIAYNNNATPADGATLTANAGDPTHGADTLVNQTYEELNNFTNSVAAINAGQDGKWDFSLKDNGASAGTTYCFRVVRDTGTVLETYSVIPEISTATAVPTPGSFNAFETSTAAGAITGVIRTKVAGSAFNLDVVAISGGVQQAGFTDVVIVELLGNNTLGVSLDAQNCPTSSTLVQTVSPNPTITGGRSTVSFAAVADSWRDVRVRVRWPAASPTVTWCSADNFAIRPDTLAGFAVTDTDWQTTGTPGLRALNLLTFAATTPTHKAGRPFSVRATAVNSVAATTTNYVGAPTATLTACAGAACTATFGTLTLATTFVAGQLASDVASYNNVGSFALQLVDSTFASVDAADTTGDCTATGRYVCSATISVGRFVPDHFAVALNTPVFGPSCGSFTYIGQTFNYTTAPVITVTAQDFANNTTTLYNTAGSWWRITNASLTGKAYTAAVGTLDVSGLPGTDPVIVSAGLGTGTLTFGSGTGIFFTRSTPTAPASPYDADISLAINVIDADGVSLATNPARFGTATAGNGISFSDGNALTTNDKQMRFGRLVIRNANGSQLVSLPVQIEAQYWSGAPTNAFITNTQDSCTSIASANDAMGNYTGNLSGSPTCETAISGGGTLSAGRRTLRLAAPGSGNNGSVDLTVNLGASASGNTCTTVGGAPGSATTANLLHLQGNWTGGAYNVNPSARATFGIFKGVEEVIFVRENF